MSHLHYSVYPGFGERTIKATNNSQAVRVGDIIHISGQGGWDRDTEKLPEKIAEEIDQVFENVEVALKENGGSGWDQVYKIRCFVLAPMMDKADDFVRNFRKYCPNHHPILTYVGTTELAFPGMNVEIEVEAHVPKNA